MIVNNYHINIMRKLLNQNKASIQSALTIALLGVAIILVVLVVVDISRQQPAGDRQTGAPTAGTVTATPADAPLEEEVVTMPAAEKDNFKAEVPVDTVVPELDTNLSADQQKEIAIPAIVVPAAIGSESKFRTFKISAENDTFIPTKVIANAGDTVHIDFTAVDKSYDIMFPGYNMRQSAKAGETKILEFQALHAGDFTYYCPSCGGPSMGPIGHIIIVP